MHNSPSRKAFLASSYTLSGGTKKKVGPRPVNNTARSNLRGPSKSKADQARPNRARRHPATRAVRLTHCDPQLFPPTCVFSTTSTDGLTPFSFFDCVSLVMIVRRVLSRKARDNKRCLVRGVSSVDPPALCPPQQNGNSGFGSACETMPHGTICVAPVKKGGQSQPPPRGVLWIASHRPKGG
jgi:hypothetical protein